MEALNDKLLAFMMVLTRISAFVLVAPVLGYQAIPVRVKAATVLLLSIFFTTIIPAQISAQISLVEIVLLLCAEATYGLALGLIAALVFAGVRVAGRIAERQMGMALAEVIDPLTGERAQPLSMLLEMLFIIMFLSANGHHLILLIISRSYQAAPAGTIPSIQTLTAGTIVAGSTMFTAGLRLAAPMLAAFLLLMVALGVMARVAPEMNILFISLPMRIGLGLFMTMVFIPFINGFVAEFAEWMNKLLPL
ncbi:MAG: flagellar biosynthetic protein FliR [Phycisphaerales bacterium]